MEEQLIEMGMRLSELREVKGMTKDEISKKLGMSVDEYEAYESGERDFSFSFMMSVATILGIDIMNLLSGQTPKLSDCAMVRKGQEFFIKKEGVYDYKHLAYTFKNKKAEPFFVTVAPKEEDKEFHTHEGQEFNFVLSGSMRLKVGNVSYDLNKGDSVYFNSKIPHGIKVLGDEEVKFPAVVIK